MTNDIIEIARLAGMMDKVEIRVAVLGRKMGKFSYVDSVIANVDHAVAEYILACIAQNTDKPIIQDSEAHNDQR